MNKYTNGCVPWSDFCKLQAHIALNMWNQTKSIVEEENKNQKEQEKHQSMPNMPSSVSGMMSSARSMMSSAGVSMPSGMPSFR